MRYTFLLLLVFCYTPTTAQQLSGPELLEKAITYHDPNGNWHKFKGQLNITMQTPNSSDRISTIDIDFPKSHFKIEVEKDNNQYVYDIQKDSCRITLNGKTKLSNDEIEKYRLSCERGTMFKNYYTYLYGLPMKLKDPGTIIDKTIQQKTFKNKEYLVLKATYKQEVGDDIWYFYFDPKTYAMEVYQFYHDESKNDGEYILLSGSEEINGIKMPKTRKWFFNKDDKFLGADILE